MRVLAIILISLLALWGCRSGPPESQPQTPDGSLFVELGGLAGISRVVDGLLFRIADDQRIVHHFAEADFERLRIQLIEQLCTESGGPCQYQGDSMAEAHAGMSITEAEFQAMLEDLAAAMDEEGIAPATQRRLLTRLRPLGRDIIAR
ncbi:group 1 truncated hemoglobin [Pseudomonas sp. WN033]|nr:group 1 truncated hemoglobin [Pseudomonas sp. WN033]